LIPGWNQGGRVRLCALAPLDKSLDPTTGGKPMNTLAPGDRAPDFSLPDQNGNTVARVDYIGRKLLLFFYPRANTSG
jgi:hypothetical protein